MLPALLLALAPEPACGARDGDGAGAHACRRPDRRPAGQGAAKQASRDAYQRGPRPAHAGPEVPVPRGWQDLRPWTAVALGMDHDKATPRMLLCA